MRIQWRHRIIISLMLTVIASPSLAREERAGQSEVNCFETVAAPGEALPGHQDFDLAEPDYGGLPDLENGLYDTRAAEAVYRFPGTRACPIVPHAAATEYGFRETVEFAFEPETQ